jgi:hypothetical protein
MLTQVSQFILENPYQGDGSGLGPQNALTQFDRDEAFIRSQPYFLLSESSLRSDKGVNLLRLISPQDIPQTIALFLPEDDLETFP